MIGASNGEASVIAAMALEFHRSPTKFPELLRGNARLPGSINNLLRLAGGTALEELDPSLASVAPESQLRTAALFFIEQVLMQREASHYRVLGLNHDASNEQIKEHHRLLMRLFHPDRESLVDQRRDQFATRVNLAYNTLRDAAQRNSYDATLKTQTTSPIQSARRPPPMIRRRMAAPESFWTVRVYPVLMRYLPQWVLAGTAFVSFVVVGAVYLFNPPVNLQQTQVASVGESENVFSNVPTTATVVDAARNEADRLDEVVAQFERRIAAAGQALSDSFSSSKHEQVELPAEATNKHASSKMPQVPASSQPAPNTMLKAAEAMPVKPVQKAFADPEPSVAQILIAPKSEPVASISYQNPQTSTQPKAASAPSPVHADASSSVSQAVTESAPARVVLPDPNSLLARFLVAYERGDMQACMALLDEGLRADAGGKTELGREYEALFRGTDLRHVRILSMSWTRDGEFIRGEGRYRSTLMRKGETLLRSQDGQLRVEFVRRGNTALISELYYLAGSRS